MPGSLRGKVIVAETHIKQCHRWSGWHIKQAVLARYNMYGRLTDSLTR